MPTDSPPNTPGRMPGSTTWLSTVPPAAAQGAHRVLPQRGQRPHRVPGADHDREVGRQERDEHDAGLVGGEQQDRHRHHRDRRNRPGQLGQRTEQVGEQAGAAEQHTRRDADDGGQSEAGENAQQRLRQVKPVVVGLPSRRVSACTISVTVGSVSNRSQQPHLAGGEQLPQPDRGGHRRKPQQPRNATAKRGARGGSSAGTETASRTWSATTWAVIANLPVPVGNPRRRCPDVRPRSDVRRPRCRTGDSSGRHAPRPPCRRTTGCPARCREHRPRGPWHRERSRPGSPAAGRWGWRPSGSHRIRPATVRWPGPGRRASTDGLAAVARAAS